MTQDILPTQLLEDLKYEVEALKKKVSAPDSKMQELMLEMESLKDSLHELTVVFQKALEEAKEEDIGKLLKTTTEKLETVVNQNETIARGMIAISDKLDDWMKRQNGAPFMSPSAMPLMTARPAAPVQHAIGLPMQPGRSVPRPMEGPTPLEEDIPPPPTSKKRSLGLF